MLKLRTPEAMDLRGQSRAGVSKRTKAWKTMVHGNGPPICGLLQRFRSLEREALDDLLQEVFYGLAERRSRELPRFFRTRSACSSIPFR